MEDWEDLDEDDYIWDEDDYYDEEDEMPRMTRRYHGGYCCGMTHIQGFPYDPISEVCEQKVKTTSEMTNDAFFAFPHLQGVYPQETGEARLKRLIDETKEERKYGIIEVVHTKAQSERWEETLLKHGFKRVNEHKNSNSGNTCIVYHLNTE